MAPYPLGLRVRDRESAVTPFPPGPFDVIYADPPWFYGQRANTDRFRGGCRRHYDVMKDDEILAMPVADIAADNCALFLWATCPNLPIAIDVIKAWGFRYTTAAFIWWKMNPLKDTPFFGPGYYTASNGELCLLGVKGKMKPEAHVSQVIQNKRREHSRKPNEAHERIGLMYPQARRIELFAREQVENWTAWGNQVGEPPRA